MEWTVWIEDLPDSFEPGKVVGQEVWMLLGGVKYQVGPTYVGMDPDILQFESQLRASLRELSGLDPLTDPLYTIEDYPAPLPAP